MYHTIFFWNIIHKALIFKFKVSNCSDNTYWNFIVLNSFGDLLKKNSSVLVKLIKKLFKIIYLVGYIKHL